MTIPHARESIEHFAQAKKTFEQKKLEADTYIETFFTISILPKLRDLIASVIADRIQTMDIEVDGKSVYRFSVITPEGFFSADAHPGFPLLRESFKLSRYAVALKPDHVSHYVRRYPDFDEYDISRLLQPIKEELVALGYDNPNIGFYRTPDTFLLENLSFVITFSISLSDPTS